MKSREIIGYALGFAIFALLLPLAMWGVSGKSSFAVWQIGVAVLLVAVGFGISVWCIAYMREVGKGNPMDAFNHEVAPRTINLMTEGPYKLCRNPMVLGVVVAYVGLQMLFLSWQSFLVFVAYLVLIALQIRKEEQRLVQDFGKSYLEYRTNTKRLIPFVW